MTNEEKRFWNKVVKTETCWLWIGAKDYGYGRFMLASQSMARAHRYAYELLYGAIPDGYQIDHLCKTRACVKPDHLEAVTGEVNNLRSNSPSAVNARKTHCKRGHALSGENLYINPESQRICRECKRIVKRESNHRIAQAIRNQPL